ncbi:MAG: phenylalanine--tRNA ligase subunit alpha [Candidatus Woesearchaeota archaeon]
MEDKSLKKLINSLNKIERKILPYLDKYSTIQSLMNVTDLKEVEITRGLQWLQNKKIVSTEENTLKIIDLDINGKDCLKQGLPERRLLSELKKNPLTLKQCCDRAKLSKDELNIAIGVLRKKAAIFITKEKDIIVKIMDNGKNILSSGFLEEKFLQKDFPLNYDSLTDEERFSYENLKKRKKIIKTEVKKDNIFNLTDLGKDILKENIDSDFIDTLTPDIIKDKSWKNKEFRRYDVTINVPSIYGGKRHFARQAIDHVKRVWLDLGFKEMKGTIVNTSFWNFDALFTAQDHPVRELQDTFYLKNPRFGKLPDKKIVAQVKRVHENGGNTGSKGWQYLWDEEEASRNVLRTHTTVLSAQTIAKLKKEDLPAKFFSVGKCFRNETMDWKHLFEFYQVEGIVVDPDANFRNHIAYLRAFFKKLGFPDARFRPAYFPYTEMSLEIEVYHPVHKQWMELGGSGIFRPEVVEPIFGEPIPVLAWGLGIPRMIMDYYKLNDVRDLYKNDIKQLREIKSWVK